MDADLTKALTRFADTDMRWARKQGDVLITGTKRGTLCLAYDADAKTYTLTTTGLDAEKLAEGKPKDIRPVLTGLYDVVYEDAA